MGFRYKIIGFKLISVLFILAVFLVSFFVVPALAGYGDGGSGQATGLGTAFDNKEGSPLNAVAEKGAGFNTSATFEGIIGLVITTVMGLLGVIFLVLAVYAGFKWMTAAGNEDAVEKAKSTLTSAIIGLVVVLAAYVISEFVVGTLGDKVFK